MNKLNSRDIWGAFSNQHQLHCFGSFKSTVVNSLNNKDRGLNQSKRLVRMNQTHSNDVCYISKQDSDDYSVKLVVEDSLQRIGLAPFHFLDTNESIFLLENELDYVNGVYHLTHYYSLECDAMISDDLSVILSVRTADCLPLFIVGDGYFSVIHAGRVGTLNFIVKRVCLTLKHLGVTNISAWFGPASCVCCYEVDRDTKTHFDLYELNRDQILSVYPDYDHYEPSKYNCTQCYSDDFYSYRMGAQKNRNIFYLTAV